MPPASGRFAVLCRKAVSKPVLAVAHRPLTQVLKPVLAMLMSLAWLAPSGAAGQNPPPTPPPAVGEEARDFTLTRIDGRPIALSVLTQQGPVVVLMLRGWVGYQ